MIQTSQPNVKLNGIEYLLLSIQSHPGESQRFHLKRLHMYQHGRPDYHKGGTNCGYFISSSYRNVTWHDLAPKGTFYECSLPIEPGYKLSGKYGGMKSKSAEMHLTMHGWTRANEARIKLGLAPIRASFKDCNSM
jgi:hypothetical protein|tara:strand:+ start:752 stop:1156 length:405 start_codon:yes stop_codon:yes gene_type:complete